MSEWTSALDAALVSEIRRASLIDNNGDRCERGTLSSVVQESGTPGSLNKFLSIISVHNIFFAVIGTADFVFMATLCVTLVLSEKTIDFPKIDIPITRTFL